MALATAATPPISASAFTGPHMPRSGAVGRLSIPSAGLIAVVDAAAVVAPLLIVLARRHADAWPAGLSELLAMRITLQDITLVPVVGALVIGVFHAAGLYDAARVRRRTDEVRRACLSAALVASSVVIVASSRELPFLDREALLWLWAMTVIAVTTTRMARSLAAGGSRRSRRAIVIGSGPKALRVCRELSRQPLHSYRILGFVDTMTQSRSPFVVRRTLGELDELETILAREHVDEVHVALPVKSHYHAIQETIRVCERLGVTVVYGADLFDSQAGWARADGAAGAIPRIELHRVNAGFSVTLKRGLDVVCATLALLVTAPLMVAIAVAIKLTSPGAVIYAAERYGINRSRFRMFKFRTMVADAEQLQATLESLNEAGGPVFKIARDPRVTRLGRWLRRTSLDELPQLVNVLRGEMSLVGPRPLPVRDVLRFTRLSDLRRFSVRPGLTGLWQVSGRSQLNFDRWIALDLAYIDRWSLGLDFAILARTIPAVVRGTGAV